MSEDAVALKQFLTGRLFGQDEVLDDLATQIAHWDREKPLVIMLAGPPGVGKVVRARVILSNSLFPPSLIRQTEFCNQLARYFQPRCGDRFRDLTIVDEQCVDGRLAVQDGPSGDVELQTHRLLNQIACGQYQTKESLTGLVGASTTYEGDDGQLYKAAAHASEKL
jgi:DNA polymerase III delta prime subunit